jgi:hypothetical protein
MLESLAEPSRIIGIPFTTENASENAKRSWEIRRAQPQREADIEARRIQADLSLVEEQIRRARKELNDEDSGYCEHCKRQGMPPHHRAQLMKAIDTLLERKRILLCRPGPGVVKSTAPRQSRDRAPIAPVDVPQPETQQSVPEPPSA